MQVSFTKDLSNQAVSKKKVSGFDFRSGQRIYSIFDLTLVN